jgi:hypothetical protein
MTMPAQRRHQQNGARGAAKALIGPQPESAFIRSPCKRMSSKEDREP